MIILKFNLIQIYFWLIKNIYIPKLRFKGFADLLIRKKLNDICIIKKGDQINNSELKESGLYYYQNGGIEPSGWLDDFNNEGNAISISEGGESCGFIKWHDLPFWSGGHLYTLDINDKNINKKYIYFLLKANQKFIMKLRNGSSIPNIQKQDLNKFFLFHSNNLNEQEKIAKFFSLLDQQILLLENKLQLIEQIRLFLNNSLYKNTYKNGDEYFLEELLKNPKKEPIKDVSEYTPIKIMLNGKGFIKSNLDVKITDKGRKYYERSSGELIIGLQNFHNKSIAILDDQFLKPIMSSAIASFISKTDDDLFIIKEMLLNKNHQNYILNNASGTGQKEYTVNKILQTKIKLPSKEIQQNYKNKFIKIDLLIELLNKKIKILNYRKLFYLKNIFI